MVGLNDEHPSDADANTAYEANSPRVLGETIDSETLLIDSRTGVYFALNVTGSQIWAAFISQPATIDAVATEFARLYDLAPDVARNDVAATVSAMREHELLREAPAMAVSQTPTRASMPVVDRTYEPSSIERFDDLEDLLLLDPIHDVDPDRGWPTARN